MAVLDADFCTDLTPADGGDTLWSPPIVAPACDPPDWPSLLEEAEARIKEERGRANVAELCREELRRSERDARAVADSLTRRLDTCRFKLKVTATKTASRAMKALERNRHADLLFNIVSSRSQRHSTMITTNRPFAEWGEAFPNAACLVALVDRLVHNAEIVAIDGDSYRRKEAEERQKERSAERRRRRSRARPSSRASAQTPTG
jgi:hypothetical protein